MQRLFSSFRVCLFVAIFFVLSCLACSKSFGASYSSLNEVTGVTLDGIFPVQTTTLQYSKGFFHQTSLNTLESFNGYKLVLYDYDCVVPAGTYNFSLRLGVNLRNKTDMTGPCLNGFPQSASVDTTNCYMVFTENGQERYVNLKVARNTSSESLNFYGIGSIDLFSEAKLSKIVIQFKCKSDYAFNGIFLNSKCMTVDHTIVNGSSFIEVGGYLLSADKTTNGNSDNNAFLQLQIDNLKNQLGKMNDGLSNLANENKKGFAGIVQSIKDGIKTVVDVIVHLPEKIFEGIKNLFVPTDAQMTKLKDSFENFASTKLGFLWDIGVLLDKFWDGLQSALSSKTKGFVFPQVNVPLAGSEFVFGGYWITLPKGLDYIFSYLRKIVDCISVLAFINWAVRKLSLFLNGRSEY